MTDSLRLVLEFDDFLDPDQDFSAITVTVRDRESGEAWEVIDVELYEETSAADTARDRRPIDQRDTLRADTLQGEADAETPDSLAVDSVAARDTTPVADTVEAPGAVAQPAPVPADTAEESLPGSIPDRRGG